MGKIQSIIVLFFSLWLTGCGYHFSGGGSLPSGIERVFVSIFKNHTSETGLENTVTRYLIQEFSRNGKLGTETGADAVLSGEIRSMQTRSISRTSRQTTTENRVILKMDIDLTDIRGRILWSRTGISESEAYDVTDDKLKTEKNRKQALIKLCERFAQRIYNDLTANF